MDLCLWKGVFVLKYVFFVKEENDLFLRSCSAHGKCKSRTFNFANNCLYNIMSAVHSTGPYSNPCSWNDKGISLLKANVSDFIL